MISTKPADAPARLCSYSRLGELTVVASAIVAVLLRIWNLDARPGWYDEYGSVFFGRLPVDRLLVATAADTMPPLYYLILSPVLAVWPTLLGARVVSLSLGLVLVALTYLLARLTTDRATAALALGLAAANPFLVYHSQEARMYSLLAVAQTAATIALFGALRNRDWRWWILFAVSESVALWTHSAAIVHLAAADLLIGFVGFRGFFEPQPSRGAAGLATIWKPAMLANLVIAISFLPWSIVLPGQLDKVQRAFWIERPGVAEILRSQVGLLFNLPAPVGWLLWFELALTVGLLALTAVTVWRRRMLRSRLGFLLWFWLGTIAVAFLISQVRPVFVERVVISSTVPALIVFASVLQALRPSAVGLAIGAVMVVLGTVNALSQATFSWFPRAPWSLAAEVIHREMLPGTVVVHDNKLSLFPMVDALPDLQQEFVADPPWSINDTFAPATQAALGLRAIQVEDVSAPRVIFVIFRQAIDEAAGQGRRPENLDALVARYTERSVSQAGDLRIYTFERP